MYNEWLWFDLMIVETIDHSNKEDSSTSELRQPALESTRLGEVKRTTYLYTYRCNKIYVRYLLMIYSHK